MRTRALPAAAVILALAGCTGAASAPPSIRQSVAPPPAPSPSAASAAPSAAPVILGVTVHWDGTTCRYEGPSVIREGTTTRFEYTFDEGTDPPLLAVVAVRPGTTWPMILETIRTQPASVLPQWAVPEGYVTVPPGTSALTTIGSAVAGQPAGGHFVGCLTAPKEKGGSDLIYPAALLEIAGAARVSVSRQCVVSGHGVPARLELDCTDVASDARLSGVTAESIAMDRGVLRVEFTTKNDGGTWTGTTSGPTSGWVIFGNGHFVGATSDGALRGTALGGGGYAGLTFDFSTEIRATSRDHELSGAIGEAD